jgi:hypothetical protein
MTIPKRHHFVPEMILNEFADEQGWLHWCRLSEKPVAVRRARPSELFHKKHLYSTVSESGVKDPQMERQLSFLESEAAAIVTEIITDALSGRAASLSPSQKRVWYLFFIMQWRRNPETQRAVVSDADALQMLDEIIDDARSLLPERREEIEALATSEGKKRIIRNVRVDVLKQLGENVIHVLEARGITILRISKPDKRFIVGSNPIVKFTPNGHTNLNDPIVEMWLPIASDVAAGVGRGNGGVDLLLLDNHAPVRHLNQTIAAQSSIIAGASSRLIESLANPR